MKIDIYKRKTVLANKIGGFSGPAIKPVAVRMVYQVSKAVDVPIIEWEEFLIVKMLLNLLWQEQLQLQ